MEVFRLAALLTRADDIDRCAERGPDVVVVHARSHNVDEDIVRPDLRDWYDLGLEGPGRAPKARLTDELGVHRGGHVAEGRHFAERVEVLDGLSRHV